MTSARHAAAEPDALRLAAAHEAAERRAAFRAHRTHAARGALIEALTALAERQIAGGGDGAADTLAEAESLLTPTLRGAAAWRGRAVMVDRTRAALAQSEARHADAVAAFLSALSVIPSDPESAGRDDNAARLQILVRLARSRLALGEAEDVEVEMRQCEPLIMALTGRIPQRAIATIRSAVLGNAAAAAAMRGRLDDAEALFEASVAEIDRLGGAELAEARNQILHAWEGAVRAGGRAPHPALARAKLPQVVPAHACGCGHAHSHDGHHDHACGCGDHHHGHHHHDHGMEARVPLRPR